jgi:hypothetical protein
MLKKITISIVLFFIVGISFAAVSPAVITLAQSVGLIGYSAPVNFYPGNLNRTHQVTLEGASAVSASGIIQGSNDGEQWLNITTFSLSAATPSAASSIQETFASERVYVGGISGIGAAVTVTVGE